MIVQKYFTSKILPFILFLLCSGLTSANAQIARPVIGEDTEYVAKEGDTLLSIAESHNTAIEHLGFANGYPPYVAHVVPGTKLYVPGRRVLPADPPYDGLVLNVPERGMYRFAGGQFKEFIPCSVGNPPDAKTPIGQWHVIEKIVDPTWYPPKWAAPKFVDPIGPGPKNPLGDRWMGLSSPNVGIHGTNNPVNVGGSVTHGCIRLYPKQARSLFEIVSVGSSVRIEYETAKLGKGKNGELYLVTFPDVYQRSNPSVAAQKILDKIGMSHLMSDPNFAAKVDLAVGTALNVQRELARVKAAERM